MIESLNMEKPADMSKFLVISALGHDQPGIVDELSRVILDCQCNIVDSRMSVLGGEFAVILLVAAPGGQQLAKLQARLPQLEDSIGLTLITRETSRKEPAPGLVPYEVSAVAIDHPGIVHQIARFFSSQGINIENLTTDRYAAAHTGTPMFAMHMQISVPADIKIGGLRARFLEFCDELNIDASLTTG